MKSFLSVLVLSLFVVTGVQAQGTEPWQLYRDIEDEYLIQGEKSARLAFESMERMQQEWEKNLVLARANEPTGIFGVSLSMKSIEAVLSGEAQTFPVDMAALDNTIRILEGIDTNLSEDILESVQKSIEDFMKQLRQAKRNEQQSINERNERRDEFSEAGSRIRDRGLFRGAWGALKDVGDGIGDAFQAEYQRGQRYLLDRIPLENAIDDLNEVNATIQAIRQSN